ETIPQAKWGLNISPRSGTYLRELLQKGAVRIHVKVLTKFYESTQRALVAEIPGSSNPDERIYMVSHIDNAKPGANNNASGASTHTELAATLARMIRTGKVDPPLRTITFEFGVERDGSTLWMNHNEDSLTKIVGSFNADMTGANTELTGGVYTLERMPDPASLHFPRPEAYTPPFDQHTDWGMRPLGIDVYPGHFLNDFSWGIVEPYAQEIGWKVSQNPHEGGSDHDVLLPRFIPVVLSWYFPDYYMGTNMDTPDKVSPESMKNVAVVHGNGALTLASADEQDARSLLKLIEKEAQKRLEQELGVSKDLLADISSGILDSQDITLTSQLPKELDYLKLWIKWYEEALLSVETMPVGGAKDELRQEIQDIRDRFKKSATYTDQLLEFAKEFQN
ncbi:M28 family peptidase, partial [Acidobacteriota bacterium]